MKIRNGFVSNSSSSSFLITNTSDKPKTLVHFISENPHLLENFNGMFKYREEIKTASFLYSVADNNINFAPGESKECTFGDEDGTLVGEVFDYILRSGGQSDSFTWEFLDYLR